MEQRRIGRLGRTLIGSVALGGLLIGGALPVAAHSHTAENGQAGAGQVLANGQNHPRFLSNGDGTFSSCLSYGPIPGRTIGHAWYGLETAHHGPDSGDPGKGDGCYTADGSPALGQDDRNPAIN
ncbi:MAG: hypothetical protein H0V74_05495 [Chloroflexi bacterium]|nr:hypothetical protein [Chloroflexota bacterium]